MRLIFVIGDFLDANLGRCPKCMRQSFMFMLAAIGAALVSIMLPLSPVLRTAGAALVVAFGLWLAHMSAFALRAARHGGQPANQPPADLNAATPSQSRRGFKCSWPNYAVSHLHFGFPSCGVIFNIQF